MAFVRRRLKNKKPRVLINTNEDGEVQKLHKSCFVKVIIQDKVQPHLFVAPAGKGYSESDIDDIRERVINYLDKRFPHFEFKEVRVASNKAASIAFNYIATDLRGGQSAEEFMDDQSKRFDPEAFVAAVRTKSGSAAAEPEAAGTAAEESGEQSDNKDSARSDRSAEGGSIAAEAPDNTTSGTEADCSNTSARGNCEIGMQEPGAQNNRDHASPDESPATADSRNADAPTADNP